MSRAELPGAEVIVAVVVVVVVVLEEAATVFATSTVAAESQAVSFKTKSIHKPSLYKRINRHDSALHFNKFDPPVALLFLLVQSRGLGIFSDGQG